MEPDEQVTGTRDEHYNLISVLYHALHGAENCEIYATDAEAGGRAELAELFREGQEIQRELAQRAKGLLGIEGAGGATPGAMGEVTDDDTLAGGVARGVVTAGGATVGGAAIEDELPAEDVLPPSDTAPVGGDVPPDSAVAPTEPVTAAALPREPDLSRGGERPAPSEASPRDIDAPPPVREDVGPDAPTIGEVSPPIEEVSPPGDLTDAPREEAPPLGEDMPERQGEVPVTDAPREVPRSGEEPLEPERDPGAGTVEDPTRESGRRSRGEI